jgi:hypothetical protein
MYPVMLQSRGRDSFEGGGSSVTSRIFFFRNVNERKNVNFKTFCIHLSAYSNYKDVFYDPSLNS